MSEIEAFTIAVKREYTHFVAASELDADVAVAVGNAVRRLVAVLHSADVVSARPTRPVTS